jgi:hypothetical protein
MTHTIKARTDADGRVTIPTGLPLQNIIVSFDLDLAEQQPGHPPAKYAGSDPELFELVQSARADADWKSW